MGLHFTTPKYFSLDFYEFYECTYVIAKWQDMYSDSQHNIKTSVTE